MKPFQPNGTLTRAQLIAYAQGRLTPEEQHRVEQHLEQDPLLRDAVEGLQQTGAMQALAQLDTKRPLASTSNASVQWIAGIVILGGLIAGWYLASAPNPKEPMAERTSSVVDSLTTPLRAPMEPLRRSEITAAEEQPKRDRIGHERMALHTREAAELTLPRETGATRVDPRATTVQQTEADKTVKSADRHRTSIQLLFVHDLKMVHPQELYSRDPVMSLLDAHVAARFTDADARDSIGAQDLLLSYTSFMDEALGRFSRNDHKGCLDDLRFVLTQYPDDVNALFYGGLCAYNLGLYDHAREFLDRAATHPVDVFDEEAAWYHALTLDRMADPGAQDAFGRIANSGGFYSELAKGRLVPPTTR